jgi:hypothetical protein
MDGSGTMTFNNATIHADTLKAVIFGANGTLRIGGGSIFQANTLLHLYAPGSNGLVDFVANTTLDSSGTAAVIAANTVTIENGVVVTIAASTSANVYTNFPNYSARSGGNNKTSGTFVGAVTTQPLGGQPPFDSPIAAHAATKQSRSIASAGGRGPTIHVTDSSQLGALLNNSNLGPDGKVRVSPHGRAATSLCKAAREPWQLSFIALWMQKRDRACWHLAYSRTTIFNSKLDSIRQKRLADRDFRWAWSY